jgi:DNA repair exonuclease SbcCD ATPase subunit
LEQQNQELQRELEVQKLKFKEEIERELGISSGLRDRIGTLDEKRRKAVSGLEEAERRENGIKGELEALRNSTRIDIERLEREVTEARASLPTGDVDHMRRAVGQPRSQVLVAEDQIALTR